MQGDIAFIIAESNNDSDFNSCMKMYACIKVHERNSFSGAAREKKMKLKRKYQTAQWLLVNESFRKLCILRYNS